MFSLEIFLKFKDECYLYGIPPLILLLFSLAALRKSKDECICGTQCIEVVHIPSLSFASISMDEDAIKSRSQDEKMAVLQEKLTNAREIAYRVADDKYRQTMCRMFHMDDKVSAREELLSNSDCF